MKGILTLAQLREGRPGAGLQAELATGRVWAIGLRNGRQSESIPRETWAHYRMTTSTAAPCSSILTSIR